MQYEVRLLIVCCQKERHLQGVITFFNNEHYETAFTFTLHTSGFIFPFSLLFSTKSVISNTI
jgi:hypothetical protein